MTDRIKALKSKLGITEEVSIPFSLATAKIIKNSVGTCMELKEAIVKFVISQYRKPGLMGCMCSYIYNIVSWSDAYHYFHV